jgi:membrane protein implicated in regulation of membrane protease activity
VKLVYVYCATKFIDRGDARRKAKIFLRKRMKQYKGKNATFEEAWVEGITYMRIKFTTKEKYYNAAMERDIPLAGIPLPGDTATRRRMRQCPVAGRRR